jgi:hypothetical protein
VQKHKRRENPRRIIWHYTVGVYLPSIIASGVIRRAVAGITSLERPVTWFSLNSTWEVTASKALLFAEEDAAIQMECTRDLGKGLVRIGVEQCSAPFGIDDLQRIARVDRLVVRELKRIGIRYGANPSDWRFTPKEVPAALWKCIEVWDGEGRWEPYNGDLLVPAPVPVGSVIG